MNMEEPMLFTKPDCPKCEKLKERCGELPIPIYDATTPRGMAIASFHEVLKMNFPILVKGDLKIAGDTIKIRRHLQEWGMLG